MQSNPQCQSERKCSVLSAQCSVTDKFRRTLLTEHCALSTFILLSLSSCTVGPNFTLPDIRMPKKFKEGASTADIPAPGEWWTLFHSTQLTRLVNQALENNQDLRGAQARVETARALVGVKRSDWFPQLSFNQNATVERVSASSFSAFLPPGVPTPETERDRYHTTFDLGFEADVWGRVRRSVESARASQQSAMDTLSAQRLTIAGEVGRNFFLLRSLDAQRHIVNDTIKLRQEALNLQDSRFKGGLANEMDVARSRTELELARNDLAILERQRGSAEHALAVLCGQMPSEFRIASDKSLPSPPAVPSGLPSQLLQRRPDIRAAEQNLRAANAEIGVAEASFYPTFKLTGAAGFETIGTDMFFDWQNRVLSIGPSISAPLFTGGRLKASLAASKSRYEETLASYRQSILVALRDVEDALLDLRAFAKQRAAVNAALNAANDTSRLARLRYDKGLASYFEVVDADRTVLTTRLALAQIDGQRLVSSVILLKALGGGWK
jgi:outer membrane protein, multidrug efflux system